MLHRGFGRLNPGESEADVRRKKAPRLPQEKWQEEEGEKYRRPARGTPKMRRMPWWKPEKK